MTFPNTIDIEQLLKPISDDSPVGEDIREDRSPSSDYYFIKDARNGARAAERNAMFGNEEVDLVSPWRDVAEAARKILTKKSKDLEVASWYVEALLRTKKWAGLRDGIKLVRGLVDKYWDDLYPLPDEDGLETKVAPITGLNGDGGEGTLITPLRNAEVTEGGPLADFSIYQYQQARDADRIADAKAKEERIGVLGYSFKDVQDAIVVTQADWCTNLVATLEETIEDYKALSASLREHCGNDAPPSSNISGILAEVLRTVNHIYEGRLEAPVPEAPETDESESTAKPNGTVPSEAGQNFVSGTITNREDALRALEQVVRYYRTYEPHTPLAASIERVIAWGRMPVASLMMELLPDDNARSTYTALTGVKLDGSDAADFIPPPPTPKAASAPTSQPAQSSIDEGSEPGGGKGW